VLSGEARNTNFIVFGLARTHDLLHSRRGANYYTTDAVWTYNGGGTTVLGSKYA